MLTSRLIRFSVPLRRYFHHEFTSPNPKENPATSKTQLQQQNRVPGTTLSGAVEQKYKLFRDVDSPEIFDVEEERRRYQIQDEPEIYDAALLGLNMKRGVHGVFDIEDLVDVLRKENADDIFVCFVPKEFKYVDYMVVCSGRSYRHMVATAEFVRRIYKLKRNKNDLIPKIEGAKSRDWMALDLGNIALHIFSPKARKEYDLESLWAIGAEFDKECNKPQDPLLDLYAQHPTLLNDLQPK